LPLAYKECAKGFILAAAGIVVGGGDWSIQFVEVVHAHGVAAAINLPAVVCDVAAIIVGEGIFISSRTAYIAADGLYLAYSRPAVATRN
jgi:hypothetical protein